MVAVSSVGPCAFSVPQNPVVYRIPLGSEPHFPTQEGLQVLQSAVLTNSRRRDSDPRPQLYESRALPLSYAGKPIERGGPGLPRKATQIRVIRIFVRAVLGKAPHAVTHPQAHTSAGRVGGLTIPAPAELTGGSWSELDPLGSSGPSWAPVAW